MTQQNPWWEQLPPNIWTTGDAQVAINSRYISQTMIKTLGSATPEDVEEVRKQLDNIQEQIQDLPPDKRAVTEYHLGQIREELSKKPGTLSFENLKKSVEWIIKNVPSGLSLLRNLFALVTVGKILSPMGDTVLTWVKSVFG